MRVGPLPLWLRLNVDPEARSITMPPKHRYLYPLDRAMRRQLAKQKIALPYPRGLSVDGDTWLPKPKMQVRLRQTALCLKSEIFIHEPVQEGFDRSVATNERTEDALIYASSGRYAQLLSGVHESDHADRRHAARDGADIAEQLLRQQYDHAELRVPARTDR